MDLQFGSKNTQIYEERHKNIRIQEVKKCRDFSVGPYFVVTVENLKILPLTNILYGLHMMCFAFESTGIFRGKIWGRGPTTDDTYQTYVFDYELFG